MWVFGIGIPLVGGVVVVFLAWRFFDVAIWQGVIAIPLIFVFTLIAVNSTALTSITPTGALGKLTQLTYGAIAPGNITTNLATAAITAEVASNASNLLMDIKPGYMLGGKPRQQAIGHVLGIFAGALVVGPDLLPGLSAQGPRIPDHRAISDAVRHRLEGGRRVADRGNQQPGDVGPLGCADRQPSWASCSKCLRTRHQGPLLALRRRRRPGRGDSLPHLPGDVPGRSAVLAGSNVRLDRHAVASSTASSSRTRNRSVPA